MSTIRYFGGARGTGSKMGEAARLKRWEIIKGGPLAMTPNERYKHILKKKLEEYQAKSQSARMAQRGREMSHAARSALEQIARRKAVKEEKAMRQMVVIKPRNYGDVGRIDAQGRVFDQANNIVLKVNRKNGKISSTMGGVIGKYRPKRMGHRKFMEENIVKFSPYHIRLRQMMMQQQAVNVYGHRIAGSTVHGPAGENVSAINVYGYPTTETAGGDDGIAAVYGRAPGPGLRAGAGVTGWGVVSSNVHGTFNENVWGAPRDNVWGGVHSNIWGGLGDDGSLWGSSGGGIWGRSGRTIHGSGDAHHIWGKPGRNIFRSGRPGQKNYLAIAFWSALSAMGIGGKLAARRNARSARLARMSAQMGGRTGK